jgi:hypothetical protein
MRLSISGTEVATRMARRRIFAIRVRVVLARSPVPARLAAGTLMLSQNAVLGTLRCYGSWLSGW